MLPSKETLEYLINNLEITKKRFIEKPDFFFKSQHLAHRPLLFTEVYDVVFIPKDTKMEREMIEWFDFIYNGDSFIWGKDIYAFSNEKITHMFPMEVIPSEIKESMGYHYKTPCKFKMNVDWMVL